MNLQNKITSLLHLSDLRCNYTERDTLQITNSFDSFLAKNIEISERKRANIPPVFLLPPDGFLQGGEERSEGEIGDEESKDHSN